MDSDLDLTERMPPTWELDELLPETARHKGAARDAAALDAAAIDRPASEAAPNAAAPITTEATPPSSSGRARPAGTPPPVPLAARASTVPPPVPAATRSAAMPPPIPARAVTPAPTSAPEPFAPLRLSESSLEVDFTSFAPRESVDDMLVTEPREKLTAPRLKLEEPRKKAEIVREKTLPREKIELPRPGGDARKTVDAPRMKVRTAREKVELPRANVETPRENSDVLRAKVEVARENSDAPRAKIDVAASSRSRETLSVPYRPTPTPTPTPYRDDPTPLPAPCVEDDSFFDAKHLAENGDAFWRLTAYVRRTTPLPIAKLAIIAVLACTVSALTVMLVRKNATPRRSAAAIHVPTVETAKMPEPTRVTRVAPVVAAAAAAPEAAPAPAAAPAPQAAAAPAVAAEPEADVAAAPAVDEQPALPPGKRRIFVRSQPEDATLTLVENGVATVVGQTPIAVTIDRGRRYDLVIAKAGFPTRLTKFDPNSDELVVSLTTESAPVTAAKPPAKR